MGLCAFDPLNMGSGIVLSNADKTAAKTVASWSGVLSVDSKSSGKIYFEVLVDSIAGSGVLIGIGNENADETSYPGADTNSWGYHALGRKYYGGSWSAYGSAYGASAVIGVCVDIAAAKIWFAEDNLWNGDPAAGTGEAYSNLSGTYFFPFVGLYASGGTTQVTIRLDEDEWSYSAPSGFDSIECQAVISDEFGISDEVEGWLDTGYVEDSFGISDEVDALSFSGYIDDELGISDEVDASGEYEKGLSDELGISDEVDAYAEYEGLLSDELGISDLVDAFNWTKWLELNESRAIKRYYFTLTGGNDGTTDIQIPISSFQARKRTAESTYLAVIIPDFATYSSEVAARPNGEMVLEMSYILDGVESIREEIVRVDLETPTLYRGPTGRSISLAGTRTHVFVPKNVALSNPSYQNVTDGNLLYRFPSPDPYLNPGDTLSVEDEQFTVDFITYIVSEHSVMMEVHEA